MKQLLQFSAMVMLVAVLFVAGDFVRGTVANMDTGFLSEKQDEIEQSEASLNEKLENLRNR